MLLLPDDVRSSERSDTMKRILLMAVSACFLAGAQAAFAQTNVHTETKTKQTGPGPNVKTKTEITTGTVKEYEAGRKIKVSGPKNKTYSFDLDENARVDGNITVGQRVTVEWMKDAAGREHVTVLSGPGSTKGAAEMAMHEMPAAGHDLHMKSETTVHQPGPNVKTKTEMVIGTVKEYEAGKKIKVTGPDEKDYTFDLDEGVGLKGNVAVGERVKVEYTKGDNGNHVTVVTLVPKGKKAA
jgi:hypothetical protein